MLRRLFGAKTTDVGERLYAAAVEQARSPMFYTTFGAPDRIDARFELYTLHVLLLIMRLRDEGGPESADASQALFDAYVSALDHALRELGVGDVSIGKKMRALGQALYGRMTAYEAPLRAGDQDALAEALARNVYETDAAPEALSLAAYALAARAALAGQPAGQILASGPDWSGMGAAA